MNSPPPGVDLSETQVPRILGVNIATYILALIAINLRFVSRRLSRAPFWWDDWLMIPAIVSYRIATLSKTFIDCNTDFCWHYVLRIHHI